MLAFLAFVHPRAAVNLKWFFFLVYCTWAATADWMWSDEAEGYGVCQQESPKDTVDKYSIAVVRTFSFYHDNEFFCTVTLCFLGILTSLLPSKPAVHDYLAWKIWQLCLGSHLAQREVSPSGLVILWAIQQHWFTEKSSPGAWIKDMEGDNTSDPKMGAGSMERSLLNLNNFH